MAVPIMLLAGCQSEADRPATTPLFADQTSQTGLTFKHNNGMSGQHYIVEMMGAGIALFDFDNDGDLDVYLGQGHLLSTTSSEDASGSGDRLYRNELVPGGVLRFTDVTDISGIRANGYNIGVAVADIDNDGWNDLYLTNFGTNQLWHNQGDGTFREMSEQSDVQDGRWSSSAAFLDYDNDGLLDLYVTNYIGFRLNNHKTCRNELGAAEYCGPSSYSPTTDRLLKNLGNRRFEDVTSQARLLKPGPGLGVVTADFNLDGWMDIYIANDLAHNHLWMNNGNGSFREEALMRGNAVNSHGQPEASMGVDAADIDNDGDADLFMTHLLNETNTLYLNNGTGQFTDMTSATGLASTSIGYTGFGTAFLDYDNDGLLDLVATNGEVRAIREQRDAGEPLPLKQPNQLFRNTGSAFIEVSDQVPALQELRVSRGIAIGDLDNDGDSDLLVGNNNDTPQLLLNQVGQHQHWLGVRLVNQYGRDALGSRAALILDDGTRIWRRVRTDASYISANDPRLLFGLGEKQGAYTIEVHWLDGQTESWPGLTTGQYHVLRQGGAGNTEQTSP